jgi:hypothetical protein
MNSTSVSTIDTKACLALAYFLITSAGLLVSCTTGNDSSAALPEMPPTGNDFYMDISEFSGIDFTHTFGDDLLSNVVETVGSGAAFLDYNQDGHMDLYIVNGSYSEQFSEGEKPDNLPQNRLYRNLGNGQFTDVTDEAGVGDTGFGSGVSVGDYNNDGFPDIYVCNYGLNALYHNNGDGTFSNVAEDMEVEGSSAAFSIAAMWIDYDLDGLLDLYVANYLDYDPSYNLYYSPDGYPGPLNFDGQPDILYRNLGDGRFEDVTEAVGLFREDGRAMGVGTADYNNDGYPDMYVANDMMTNYLFRNNEGKGFTDIGMESHAAFNHTGEATSSMSVVFGDYDSNGFIDMYVTDENYGALYTNIDGERFVDMSHPSGIAIPSGQYAGWGSSLIDYDNDMDVDIFKVNGEIQHLHGQEDQVFRNVQNRKFDDVSLTLGSYFGMEKVGRGAAFGDIDNDGDIDVFISNLGDTFTLLRNDKGNQNNWILIDLVGSVSSRDAIGAKVTIEAGEDIRVLEKTSAGGYLSQNDPRLHFGLADHTVIDRIEIRWPSGLVQTLGNVEPNQVLTIQEEE